MPQKEYLLGLTEVDGKFYYYDQDLGFCLPGKDGGKGNGKSLNRFRSRDECRKICGEFKGIQKVTLFF